MFSIFMNAFKVKEIRNKIWYIILVLAVYRIGTVIPLPGVDYAALATAKGMNPENIFTMITGNELGSLFYMGIGPYITSSIIMQLLCVAIPFLEELQKEGESGRKKINQYTRYVAVGLAFIQAAATVYSLRETFIYKNFLTYSMAVLVMVAGTMFIVWLSELLTEKGIGNGSSFIIFANILSNLPQQFIMLYSHGMEGNVLGWLRVALVVIVFGFIMAFAVRVQEGERRIPIHYSRNMAGRSKFGTGQTQFIPIKVNIAGVMAIIFAISLLQFPQTINGFINNDMLGNVVNALQVTQPIGAILYVILIFCFTFFYTSFAINPIEMAQNLKNSQGTIPGIRSGKPTSDYIELVVHRLSWIGAVYYVILAMIPVCIQWIFGIQIGISGTTLLIVVGVALEFVKNMESQLIERHYKGFLES